jgi:hypothetical protein
LTVDGQAVSATISDIDRNGFVVATVKTPLKRGQTAELEYGGAKASVSVTVDSVVGCEKGAPQEFTDDDRDAMSTPFHVGAALEQFAPGFTDTTQSTQSIRAIGGVTGEYRIYRRKPGVWNPQLWLHGGFLAGLRTYCANDAATGTNPAPAPNPVDSGASAVACDPFNPENIGQLNMILRNATSFEVGLGVRFEFLSLNRGTKFPGNVYITVRDNRFAIDRATASKFTDPVVGIGFVITGGAMRGTSFQAGKGGSSFYAANGSTDWNRWKTEFTIVTGASRSVKDVLTTGDKAKDSFRVYFAVRTDFDNGPDSDSVRVGFGLAFLPSAFFGQGVKK